MSEGLITGECIELPQGFRGLPTSTFGEVQWVDPVTGKAIVAVSQPDDQPMYIPIEPDAVPALSAP